jgi:hypothetical protein
VLIQQEVTDTDWNIEHVHIGSVIAKDIDATSGVGVHIESLHASKRIASVTIGAIDVDGAASYGLTVKNADHVTIGPVQVQDVTSLEGIMVYNATDVSMGNIDISEVGTTGVRVTSSSAHITLGQIHVKNCGRALAAQDCVRVDAGCDDVIIAGIFGETTSGNAHARVLDVTGTGYTGYDCCRVEGTTRSLGGPASETVVFNGVEAERFVAGRLRDSGAPAAGTWSRGDIIEHSAPSTATTPGWVCTISGTFSAASTTGNTDGSTAVINSVADTSALFVGEYVTVSAGFASTGPYRILAKTSSTLTVDTASNSVQTGITISTTDPTFKALAVLA